jgi:hypothetical protein
MSLQFRLGYNDQKVIEDFVSRGPVATSAIVLDPKATNRQRHAADAAAAAGVDVFWDPATELLSYEGYELEKFPMWRGGRFDVAQLATSLSARSALVEQTIATHPEGVTHLTAPHFYVSSPHSAALNVDLAEATTSQADLPVRAVLVVKHGYARSAARDLADMYVSAGVRQIELQLSPFGGEDESLRKIADGFAVAQAFTDAGLHVTLGHSGNLGQVAVALGHAAAYSVGVGMLEHVNHKTQVNRRSKPPKERVDEESGARPRLGGGAGVYLPALAYTATPKLAEKLMQHSDLRVRIGCRVAKCGTNVRGPLLDPREHYLHSRDTEMGRMMEQPAGWRATSELERLHRALILRDRINKDYLAPGDPPIKTRSLDSLIVDIERVQAAS